LLTEEVAGLAAEAAEPDEPDSSVEPYLRALERAEKRGWSIVLLDWAAILILFLTRERSDLFLTLGRSSTAVFSLAVLAVAVHSGFRLGQLLMHRNIHRACQELEK